MAFWAVKNKVLGFPAEKVEFMPLFARPLANS
jgi:hypothetical protein